jgi:hypothetical protein
VSSDAIGAGTTDVGAVLIESTTLRKEPEVTMKRFTVVLIAVVMTVTLVMSCGKKSVLDKSQGVDPVTEFKSLVAEHIQDPDTRAQILDIVEKGEVKQNEFYDFYDQHARKIAALSVDRSATRTDFEEATSVFNVRYREMLAGIVSDGFAIKELTSREEWALISDSEKSFFAD